MDLNPAAGGRLALVVDDNPQAAAITVAMLRTLGWSTDRAADGFEAIVKFRERQYAAMVLDYSLPGMDGVEVLSWVRRNLEVAPDVVVLSSEALDLLKSRFAGMGVRAILNKPVVAAELVYALKAA